MFSLVPKHAIFIEMAAIIGHFMFIKTSIKVYIQLQNNYLCLYFEY